MNHKRLLILSCSQRKSDKEGLLPAIERYDGPLFRVLRRYQKTQDTRNRETESKLDIYILSAEFGLISAKYLIPDYDRCMTRQRAQMIRPVVMDKLKNLLTGACRSQELFICTNWVVGDCMFLAWEGRRPCTWLSFWGWIRQIQPAGAIGQHGESFSCPDAGIAW